MMKVSDPIIFGHAVKVFLAEVFARHAALAAAGADPNNGLGGARRSTHCADQRWAIKPTSAARLAARAPRWRWSTPTGGSPASRPSDVIVDASMPRR